MTTRFGMSLPACALVLITLGSVIPYHTDPAVAAENLIVYSGRKEKAIKPVVEAFTKATGLPVDLKVGKTSGLANEIRMEKAHPRGDVFVSTEGGIMEILCTRWRARSLHFTGERGRAIRVQKPGRGMDRHFGARPHYLVQQESRP